RVHRGRGAGFGGDGVELVDRRGVHRRGLRRDVGPRRGGRGRGHGERARERVAGGRVRRLKRVGGARGARAAPVILAWSGRVRSGLLPGLRRGGIRRRLGNRGLAAGGARGIRPQRRVAEQLDATTGLL